MGSPLSEIESFDDIDDRQSAGHADFGVLSPHLPSSMRLKVDRERRTEPGRE